MAERKARRAELRARRKAERQQQNAATTTTVATSSSSASANKIVEATAPVLATPADDGLSVADDAPTMDSLTSAAGLTAAPEVASAESIASATPAADFAVQESAAEESLGAEEMISVEDYLELLSRAQDSEGVSASIATSRTAITVAGLPLLSKRLSTKSYLRNPSVALTLSSSGKSTPGAGIAAFGASGVGSSIAGAGTSGEGNFNFQGEWSGRQQELAAQRVALGLADFGDGADQGGGALALSPDGRGAGRSLDFWFGGSYSYFNTEASGVKQSGAIGMMQMGADTRIHDDILLGVAVSGDLLSSETSDGSRAKGYGALVGPYAVVNLAEETYLELMASYGHAFNEVASPGAGASSYESGRLLLTSRLSGVWDYEGWTIRPSTRLTYYAETQESFSAGDGGYVKSQTTRLGEARFGPEVSYAVVLDDAVLRPHVAMEGVWAFQRSEMTVDGEETAAGETLSGSLSLGVAGMFSETTIKASGRYDGIGESSIEGFTGEFVVRVPLD